MRDHNMHVAIIWSEQHGSSSISASEGCVCASICYESMWYIHLSSLRVCVCAICMPAFLDICPRHNRNDFGRIEIGGLCAPAQSLLL